MDSGRIAAHLAKYEPRRLDSALGDGQRGASQAADVTG
jgi:hypothetical protein